MIFGKKIVGIDIGTASIKVVELSRFGSSKKLENYGELKSSFIGNSETGKIDVEVIGQAIKSILNEANIKTKRAIFSIPDFSTFCTSFDIPAMTEKEIAGAISYNASQYITLPISEVTLDWQVTPDPSTLPKIATKEKSLLKVFLVAVPNQLVQDYKAIAKAAGLDLRAIEAEVFGISRALIKDNRKTVCLVDIGAKTSTINIVDKITLEKSYSFNFGSSVFTDPLLLKEGFNSQKKETVETLTGLLSPLLNEIKNISAEFLQKNQRGIEEYYLTGGVANMPGLKEYFAKTLGKSASIPNCFSGIAYPKVLGKTLEQTSPSFSAAVGVALGGLDNI